MASFYSYIRHLRAACTAVQPREVLEWGPGVSTEVIRGACPAARIISVEHSADWYLEQEAAFADDSLTEIFHVVQNLAPGQSQGYATFPMRLRRMGLGPANFDLAFVDGRSRCDCLTVAAVMLSPTGLAVIHDTERANYRACFDMFTHWVECESDRTAVLSHREEPLERYLQALRGTSPIRIKHIEQILNPRSSTSGRNGHHHQTVLNG